MIRTLSFLSVILVIFHVNISFAQSTDTSGKIKFFLACDNCDLDFIRKEISYVDYVRDPAQADVYCYVVKENAGNGGSRYNFIFLGNRQFEGIRDTLKFLQMESSTSDDFRMETAHTLSLGLARYVSHSPQAGLINIIYKGEDTLKTPSTDPWNSWVFSADINAYVFDEALHGNYNYWGSLNANRTTPDWKIKFTAFGNYNESNFRDLGLRSISRSASFDALAVRSISDHWSIGPSFTVATTTFRNRKLDLSAFGGIEYDVFPYNESTSHQFRILYKLGADKFQYFDTTIFEKTEELVGTHILSASLIFQQPWGSVEFTVAGSQYLHDLSKTELNIFANLQLRLFEGLSLRIVGSYSSIHDQLFLPKAGLTSEEILLQRSQLATNYSYYTSIGITYTFGSIYNNIVNPRFGN